MIRPEEREPEQRAPEEGLLETCVSVLSQPTPTLRRLTRDAKVWWAVIVTVAISVASSLATVAQGSAAPAFDPGFGPRGGVEAFGAVLAVLSPVFAVLGLAIAAGVLQLSSYLLGGRGGYAGLFTGLGFASLPNLLTVPARLLGLVLGAAGMAISGLVSFGLALWAIALTVIAVRENHDFSTGRAIAALLIPLAAVVLLIVIVGVALAALIASSLSR